MLNHETQSIISEALNVTTEMNPQATDGTWLEDLTIQAGPHLKEWDIARCYHWAEWPERELHFPNSSRQDVGIDAVAFRPADNQYIAIQCKARQLDESGNGTAIEKGETDKFASASADKFWAERWIVTNGNNPLSNNAQQVLSMTSKPIKLVDITSDLLQQQTGLVDEECPHCAPNPNGEWRRQTKSCMQAEAIAESVRVLKEHEQWDSGGLPVGQARGKLILPCGTGKTRISLRIIEQLSEAGDLSVVLCPSIALVAQIRREYLQHAEGPIRALAVCSDETAGYDPKKESSRNTASDPTVDNSNVSASAVKGKVTTDSMEIAQWMRDGLSGDQVNVIFGTYQSGHRIAAALKETGILVKVIIGDEAHRTAGLRRKRNAKNDALSDEEKRLRDFTLCHDNDAMPATYRVYQTATPRIYDVSKVNRDQPSDWVVRTMDDETVFGVDLFRKSYVEAVKNGWLADYRIIALGINDPDAYQAANLLATNTKSKGRRALTVSDYLRGLAFTLAMGGATQTRGNGNVPIKSCIAFMNTVDKSKNMAQDLQSDAVRNWLQGWLRENREEQTAAQYTFEHLDATSNVTARENAKRRLAESTEDNPHSVINVGIFGEGTDAPSLSAVAFLEARRSPIDVIQAVGRAMRTAPGKEIGYIICPILIPPNVDPESWLSTSNSEEGWQELGQILLALRAHDQRIEDNLEELLQLYVPKAPEVQRTMVAVASAEDRRISYREHEGAPGEAQEAIERVLEGRSTLTQEFMPISNPEPTSAQTEQRPIIREGEGDILPSSGPILIGEAGAAYQSSDPSQIVTGKKNDDGSIELRMDTVARGKPERDGSLGKLDIRRSKAKARDMINKGKGIRVSTGANKKNSRRTKQEMAERSAMQMLLLSGMEEHGNAIKMNLLSKSGLVDNRVVRDLNILETSVKEAAHHLRSDDLQPVLDRHFGLDNLKESDLNKQADGCTIASLLMMNAAMLHQRIANGRWLSGVSDLEMIKNDVNVVRRISREWNQIMRHDFRPVLEPAVKAIEAVEDTGKLAGLERSLRHIAAEAERIAETYADMGADHAGPLFNKVMGNQASDGAYFTRPTAASIAARLTLDVCGDVDWSDPAVWRAHKTVDLACGSGTLLAAMLTDMKRRARELGASEAQITSLQKLAVEETIKGLDINPVSLQLAASQLIAGNQQISYRQMGLHLMPYGPRQDNPAQMSIGTLELLGQKAIVRRNTELELADGDIVSQVTWRPSEDTELEDAVSAAKDARIVTMNPPFTNRAKMGEKFPKDIQQALRSRADAMEKILVGADPGLMEFADKNSIRPLFVALADHVQERPDGVVSMINPTIALSATSGLEERKVLAQRFYIDTVLTCHQPGNINMSQNTSINESIVVMRRHEVGPKPPTRFVHLDRMPIDENEVEDLYRCLRDTTQGQISNGWGEVSHWPADRMQEGDWSPAIWRSSELAETARSYSNASYLTEIGISDRTAHDSSRRLYENFEKAPADHPATIPVIGSKGAEGQQTIRATPDGNWIPIQGRESQAQHYGKWHSHLLVTAGQRTSTARLTAVASETKYIGGGWFPVTGIELDESKAIAVFLNSTVGRLQLMRSPGRTLEFPKYQPEVINTLRIPEVRNARTRDILVECWERTKDMEVPQFRDGECEVRRLWDEAVAEAMDWDPEELARLRQLLHNEPHVRGLGYNQYADEIEEDFIATVPDHETFERLAGEWEQDRPRGADIEQMTKHSAYQDIIALGEPAVPWILQRLAEKPDHWFVALNAITGARPVPLESRGRIKEMTQAWLNWGREQGYDPRNNQ